uniref:Uncharacterized protein n=1 Tax=Anopheles atroparvus TaxID=41427 RepID=A0A182JH50_ANOAO
MAHPPFAQMGVMRVACADEPRACVVSFTEPHAGEAGGREANSRHMRRGEHLRNRDGVLRNGQSNLGHGSNVVGNRYNALHHLVTAQWLPADDGVESVVLIGGVVDHAAVSVGIDQSVLALDVISVALFLLTLDIASVLVVDGVRELVLGRSLQLDLLHQGRQECGLSHTNHGQGEDQLWKNKAAE